MRGDVRGRGRGGGCRVEAGEWGAMAGAGECWAWCMGGDDGWRSASIVRGLSEVDDGATCAGSVRGCRASSQSSDEMSIRRGDMAASTPRHPNASESYTD